MIIAQWRGVEVRVSMRDLERAQAMSNAIQQTLATNDHDEKAPVVRLSSKATFEKRTSKVAGALVLIPIRAQRIRELETLVDLCRAEGCRGVQLVWDNREPAPSRVEPVVFSVLEKARSTPALPPVWLSEDREPLFHLLPPRPRTDEESDAHL
ncbi:MAG: hypothetical protein U0165_07730 [Polyangiaceae bacterium]